MTRPRTYRNGPWLALLLFFGAMAFGVAPGIALPAALVAAVALGRGRWHRRLERRSRRRTRAATHGYEGMLEKWDLRGVRIRMDAHQLIARSRHGQARISVHDVDAVVQDGRSLALRTLDGHLVRLGVARAEQSSLERAIHTLRDAIQRRKRGSLEDKVDMEQALSGARTHMGQLQPNP